MPYEQEVAALRAYLASGARISWEIPHARTQAKKRKVAVHIAERIVRQASVTGVTTEVSGMDRVRVSGRDENGRPVDVVVELGDEVVLVITVIRTDE
jgi:soluble P-type ATPase